MSLNKLKLWLEESNYTVVLTGAGMSTESGVPDFRSQAGWWKNIDPRTVASTEALSGQYELFREFYQMRVEALANCEPHRGHEILAEWEQRGLISFIATQNVDRFHQAAGSQNVAELHGNIMTVRCEKCRKPGVLKHFMNNAVCTYCGQHLRPNVVLFGETLPEDAWNRSLQAIEQADLVLVLGTSLEVYPVNQLPTMTRGKLVYMNLEPSAGTNFDLVIEGKIGEVLVELNEIL